MGFKRGVQHDQFQQKSQNFEIIIMKINLVSWNIYDDFEGHSLSDTCQTVQTFSSYMSQVLLIKIAFLVEIMIINFLEYLDEIEVIRGILLQDQRIAEQKIILQNLDSEIRQISTQKVSWIVYVGVALFGFFEHFRDRVSQNTK